MSTYQSQPDEHRRSWSQDALNQDARLGEGPRPEPPFAKTKAVVAKRWATFKAERAAKSNNGGSKTSGNANGRGAGGEGTPKNRPSASGDPVWLRHEFAEVLRLEEKQAEEVRAGAKELEYWRGRLAASKDAADGRRAEMQTFDLLLSTHDPSPDDHVRKSLRLLNDTIEQLSVQVSKEFLSNAFRYGLDSQSTFDKDRPRLRFILGDALYDALEASKPRDEFATLLLRYAWQACINNGVFQILEVFSVASPGMPENYDVDAALRKAGRVAEREECQPVYGHWRAMTHRYLRTKLSPHELDERLDHFVQDSWSLCRLATAVWSNEPSFGADWMDKALSRLTLIIDSAWKLATTVREECITKNFSIYRPQYKAPFDAARMSVDDAMDAKDAEHVVCTIRLGLTFSSKPGRDRGPTTPDVLFEAAQILANNTVEALRPVPDVLTAEVPQDPPALPESRSSQENLEDIPRSPVEEQQHKIPGAMPT